MKLECAVAALLLTIASAPSAWGSPPITTQQRPSPVATATDAPAFLPILSRRLAAQGYYGYEGFSGSLPLAWPPDIYVRPADPGTVVPPPLARSGAVAPSGATALPTPSYSAPSTSLAAPTVVIDLPPAPPLPQAPLPGHLTPTAGPGSLPAVRGASPSAPSPVVENGPTGALTPHLPPQRYVDGFYATKRSYILSWPQNAWRFVTAPTRFDHDDWLTLAAVVGITGGLIALDQPIDRFWQNHIRSDFTDSLARGFTPIGDTIPALAGSLGFYALGEVTDAPRAKAAGLMAFQSVVLAQLTATGLKYVTGRDRPEENRDAHVFRGPAANDPNASFPSGHATASFALATVLSDVYGDSDPWVPWVVYPIAGLVSLSRINDERHWASDVFVGAALGHFMARLVTTYNPFLAQRGIAIQPLTLPNGGGLALQFHY